MRDDSMSPDFRSTVHPMPNWGIFRFRRDSRILMDLYVHHHLLDTHWDVDMFIAFSSYLSRASLDPFSQILTPWHRVAVMFHILRYISWMCGFDLDHRDHMFDDRWFQVTRSPTYHTFDAILGAYFRYGWDLQIMMELDAYPHLQDVHRDNDLFTISTVIP